MIAKYETIKVTREKRRVLERKCDICNRMIEHTETVNWGGGKQGKLYNYYKIHTWHNDWGNDSVDSHVYYDACCPDCVLKFAGEYLDNAYETAPNTMGIEITHVRWIEDGTDRDWFIKGR